MSIRKPIIVILIFVLFSLLFSSFSNNKSKKIYGKWNAVKIYLGNGLEPEMKNLNEEQKDLIASTLDSFFIKGTSVEFSKNKKYTLKFMGTEEEGTWKQENADVIKLYSETATYSGETRLHKDTTVLKVHPDKLQMLVLPEENVYIVFSKTDN